MNQVGGDHDGFLRRNPGGEAAFQHGGLVPRDGLHGGVSDARTLRRKRRLLQDREHVRQHRGSEEIGKPQAQIEGIGHTIWAEAAQPHFIIVMRLLQCAAVDSEELYEFLVPVRRILRQLSLGRRASFLTVSERGC